MFDATPFFRLYAQRRWQHWDRLDPVEAQHRQLLSLVGHAKNTAFGKRHSFANIKTVEDYQILVPLRRYEDFWQDYWQHAFPVVENVTWPGKIPYFAKTSGTTSGDSKYIPCSHEMVRSNRRAALDILAHHLRHNPKAKPLGGKTFMLGGSTDLIEEAPGVFSGDLSGIASHTVPGWAQIYSFPPKDLALISDWDEKLDRLCAQALREPIRAVSGSPNWLLILFERMKALRASKGDRGPAFPDLELLIHGGTSFAPYRSQFEDYLAETGASTREVYPASEGFIAMQDAGPEDGLGLLLDHGLFIEFVPADELDDPAPTRHWLGTVKTGIDYALVITSNAGLWSYVIGDTVRVVGTHPPRIEVSGRTSYSLLVFGEHLIGAEIEAAVIAAADATELDVTDYAMGPVFPDADTRTGHHLYVVECAQLPESAEARHELAERFRAEVDAHLSNINADYATVRQGDLALAPPVVVLVPHGTFAGWMRTRGRLGGQNKVPRVIANTELFETLKEFIAQEAL